MPDQLDPKELVTFKEALLSNVYEQEALINLLERKGIIISADWGQVLKYHSGHTPKIRSRS
jgi:hypothetical protein